MVGLSVYEEAERAAHEHKWLESEKAGRDLGDEAVREWTRSYWLGFYRWRFVQHVRGEAFFREFDPQTYGIVSKHLAAPRELLDEILDQVRRGAENLDVFCWAHSRCLPSNQVIEILEALDINQQRLSPPGR